MWQRIQTIFLLIASLVAVGFIFLPIAEMGEGLLMIVKDDIITTSISIAISLISLFTIPLYKNRKLQIRFCLINIILALALAGAAIYASAQYSSYLYTSAIVRYEFAVGIPVLIIIVLLFARKNIRKDEALVKSMDRFR